MENEIKDKKPKKKVWKILLICLVSLVVLFAIGVYALHRYYTYDPVAEYLGAKVSLDSISAYRCLGVSTSRSIVYPSGTTAEEIGAAYAKFADYYRAQGYSEEHLNFLINRKTDE